MSESKGLLLRALPNKQWVKIAGPCLSRKKPGLIRASCAIAGLFTAETDIQVCSLASPFRERPESYLTITGSTSFQNAGGDNYVIDVLPTEFEQIEIYMRGGMTDSTGTGYATTSDLPWSLNGTEYATPGPAMCSEPNISTTNVTYDTATSTAGDFWNSDADRYDFGVETLASLGYFVGAWRGGDVYILTTFYDRTLRRVIACPTRSSIVVATAWDSTDQAIMDDKIPPDSLSATLTFYPPGSKATRRIAAITIVAQDRTY